MKTYCISDIHGHYENLNNFLNNIDNDDVVYVLGDVIDKGKTSIKALKTIMDDSRCKMLLGNHEYMMFQYLSAKENSYEQKTAYSNWVGWNSGGPTLDEYHKLTRAEQLRIFAYLDSLPLNYPKVLVNNKCFNLVHSYPYGEVQMKMKDYEYNEDYIAAYVWERVEAPEDVKLAGQIVVAGHTPVLFYLGMDSTVTPIYDGEDISKAHYIDIDGGLAANGPNSKLIALCLDDLTYQLF